MTKVDLFSQSLVTTPLGLIKVLKFRGFHQVEH